MVPFMSHLDLTSATNCRILLRVSTPQQLKLFVILHLSKISATSVKLEIQVSLNKVSLNELDTVVNKNIKNINFMFWKFRFAWKFTFCQLHFLLFRDTASCKSFSVVFKLALDIPNSFKNASRGTFVLVALHATYTQQAIVLLDLS